MDATSHNEGSGKKKGLARRAKSHTLSNSLSNLHVVEAKAEEKDDPRTTASQRPPDQTRDQSDQQVSPLRNLTRPGTAAVVTLLPNKMNVSELSGQQQQQQHGERRTRCIQEDTLSLDSSGPTHVPCSDPDFIRNTKSGVRGTQSYPIAATRNSICGGENLDGRMSGFLTLKTLKSGKDGATHKKVSPLLPRRSQLALPKVKVKRSSSMTRLTEALNQVHNVCLIPAQPRTLVKKSEAQSEKNSLKSPVPESEVIGSVPLTPLTATTSRTDQMHTQSPKLMRRTAFRDTVKQNRKDSHDSSVTCASPDRSASVVFTLDPADSVSSPSVSSPSCVAHDPPDSKCLENGFGAAYPTTRTKQPSTSSKASGASNEVSGSSSRNARGRQKPYTMEGGKGRRKSDERSGDERSGDVLEADGDSPPLKHASSAPYSLMSEDEGVFHSDASYQHPALEQHRLNRSPSWCGYKVSKVSDTCDSAQELSVWGSEQPARRP